jgi:hypothetical protein
VLDVPVHHVGDRHARVEVVDDEGATGAAPERDSPPVQAVAVQDLQGRGTQAVPETPAHREAQNVVVPD